MIIPLGVYDFFSYTIPGLLYLFVAYQVANILRILDLFSFNLADLSDLSSPIAILVGVFTAVTAYILGYLMDFSRIRKRWENFFRDANFNEKIKNKYDLLEEKVDQEFSINYSYLLFSKIKKQYPGLTSDIEKYKAISIMLRNLSFGFLLLSVAQIAYICILEFPIFYIILTILFFSFARIAGRQSNYYNIWFFASIYQASITETVKPKKLLSLSKAAKADSD